MSNRSQEYQEIISQNEALRCWKSRIGNKIKDTKKRHPYDTCIYIYHNTKESRIKIGRSLKPFERFQILRIGYDPAILFPIDIHQAEIEYVYHKAFSKYNIKGEWFELKGGLKYLYETRLRYARNIKIIINGERSQAHNKIIGFKIAGKKNPGKNPRAFIKAMNYINYSHVTITDMRKTLQHYVPDAINSHLFNAIENLKKAEEELIKYV